ncbi:bifunctional phosphopantothenoylcysteine decarboxylase/phosphopantothenate--cysteine ligase CoaBC [Dermacoccaceae bacterium W4C1]
MNIVLGVSGGIAAYKACAVLRRLTEAGHQVTVIPTEAALRFVGAPTWEALSGRPVSTQVWDDVDQVNHVRLGQQADLVVVAPATADLLARAAQGLADDLLTTTLLATGAPVLMAPAMHTEMWQHPATVANVATLRSRGIHVLDPASGRLTGVDSGPGRLPEPEEIADAALGLVSEPSSRDLEGLRVLVTAGGTREALDPVRYLGNRSSGRQGQALATDAARRGAQVTLVATVPLQVPAGVAVVSVESGEQMRAAVLSRFEDQDVIVMAAAVADFRPATREQAKIKKRFEDGAELAPTIELVRNPDILAELVSARGASAVGEPTTGITSPQSPVLVGFAAETGDAEGDVLHHARQKLARKGCDLLVANEVGDGVTFGQPSSTVHILSRTDPDTEKTVGPADKSVIASAVWDAVLTLRTPSL